MNNTGSQVFDKSGGSSGGDEAFRKMVIERFRQLGKDIADRVKLEDYHAEREEVGQRLSKLAKDVGDRVTTEAYDNLIFYMEKNKAKESRPRQEGESAGQDEPIDTAPFLKMLSSTNKEVEQLKERLQELAGRLPELTRSLKEINKKADETQ